jgi:hypothetical protein
MISQEKETAGCTKTGSPHIPWPCYFFSSYCTATDNQADSCDLRTTLATVRLKPSRSSRHSFAASMLAGDSSFGEESIEMMEIIMVSTYDRNHIPTSHILANPPTSPASSDYNSIMHVWGQGDDSKQYDQKPFTNQHAQSMLIPNP